MTIIFRPHYENYEYTFKKLHKTTTKNSPFNPEFDPPYYPQCKKPIKNIIYFINHYNKKSFDYSKESADHYAKEIEKNHEAR